ncbi:MAG: DegV family protein [Acetatifactor sp.]|nr:DegV family protein [Acetatifactor sp.]
MRYKIVVDSCCELPKELEGDERFERVPLSLQVDECHIMDDETFDQADFLQKVANSSTCPKSSCPSPEKFMEAYHCDAEHVYAITLASNLSGSYNSAVLGSNLYHETYGEKDIHVIDSESASCGETQIALRIMEMEEKGLPFEEIVKQIESYRDSMRTYFVLDNLETLRKNGRLTGLKAGLVSTLNIKPIMSADKGVIYQKSQGIGMKKALRRMADIILEEAREKDQENRRLMISHCNAPDRAELVREMVMAKAGFKECIILDTKGVSSMYANDGGVIVTA